MHYMKMKIEEEKTNLLIDEFGDYITSMHINSTDCHYLLTISLTQLSYQHSDKCVELCHLLLEVILERILVAFF